MGTTTTTRKRQAMVSVAPSWRSMVHRAAGRVSYSTSQVDTEAKTRDDYEQDFFLFTWSVFRERGAVPPALLSVSLRNKAQKVRRDRQRHGVLKQYYFPTLFSVSSDDAHEERVRLLEESSCARLLERGLSPYDVKVLTAVADHPTWSSAAASFGLSRATFAAKVKQAREEAARILKEDSNHE